MNIYFNVSARGMEKYFHEYSLIANAIEKLGHNNTNPVVENGTTELIYSMEKVELEEMFDKAIKRLKNAHVVILEISIHSLTQGYLIYQALDVGVPVIALHLPGKSQAFTKGIANEKFQLVEYTPDTLHSELKAALEVAQTMLDIRFNFFINPKMNAYLTLLSEEKKLSKSDVVRTIIQEKMDSR